MPDRIPQSQRALSSDDWIALMRNNELIEGNGGIRIESQPQQAPVPQQPQPQPQQAPVPQQPQPQPQPQPQQAPVPQQAQPQPQQAPVPQQAQPQPQQAQPQQDPFGDLEAPVYRQQPVASKNYATVADVNMAQADLVQKLAEAIQSNSQGAVRNQTELPTHTQVAANGLSNSDIDNIIKSANLSSFSPEEASDIGNLIQRIVALKQQEIIKANEAEKAALVKVIEDKVNTAVKSNAVSYNEAKVERFLDEKYSVMEKYKNSEQYANFLSSGVKTKEGIPTGKTYRDLLIATFQTGDTKTADSIVMSFLNSLKVGDKNSNNTKEQLVEPTNLHTPTTVATVPAKENSEESFEENISKALLSAEAARKGTYKGSVLPSEAIRNAFMRK